MNQEMTTPDASSGQAASAPSQSQDYGGQAGFSSPNQSVSGQGTNNNVGNESSFSPQELAQLRQANQEAQRKITELGQQKSDFAKRLEAQEQRNMQFARTIAEQYGITQPQGNNQSLIDQIIDNPNYLNDVLNQMKEEVRGEYNHQFGLRDSREYLAQENISKEAIKAELLTRMSPQMAEKALDISSLVNPKIIELNQQLNNPTLSPDQRNQVQTQVQMELARELQSRGGYRALVAQRAGDLLLGNFDNLMQDAAKVYQTRQMQNVRLGSANSYKGGAQTQNPGGRYNSQTVFR
jgi:hypothetical protein